MAPPGGGWMRSIEIVGEAAPADVKSLRVPYCEASPDFFKTLELPLLKGRLLNDRDGESSTWVLVVNEAMAKQFFPNEDPIGKSLNLSMQHGAGGVVKEGQPREIVGVVGNIKRWSVKWDRRSLMYGSQRQRIREYPGVFYSTHLRKDLVIRTAASPISLAREVQRIVAEVDPDQTVYDTRTMEQALAEMLAPERFWMQLYGIFATLVVILAAVGIYGVMSYMVRRRTHEIGVRMALGAQKGKVLRLVILQGLKLAFFGLVVGLAASYWLTSLISGSLYGVTPTEVTTIVAVSALLVGVAFVASYFPARWATKVDPLVALRHE
jgi:putative ABC transport system permease protein